MNIRVAGICEYRSGEYLIQRATDGNDEMCEAYLLNFFMVMFFFYVKIE